MGWDSSRPVPWRRLIREFAIYAGIMAIVMVALFRDRGVGSILIGLLMAGPIYLVLGYVLAKFGYQRKTLADLRMPRASSSPTPPAVASDRVRPAPTKRTSTGPQHRRRARR